MSAIAQISIADRKVGLRFGLPAVIKIFSSDLSDFFQGDSYSVSGVTRILYWGYVNECSAKDIPAELTHEDFYNLIEDQLMDGALSGDIVNAVKIFEHSRATKKATDRAQEIIAEKKSQLIGNGLNPSQEENSASVSMTSTE